MDMWFYQRLRVGMKHCALYCSKTDTITSLVLDLVDKHMLLGDPMKRFSAEKLCEELRNIFEKGEEGRSKLGWRYHSSSQMHCANSMTRHRQSLS